MASSSKASRATSFPNKQKDNARTFGNPEARAILYSLIMNLSRIIIPSLALAAITTGALAESPVKISGVRHKASPEFPLPAATDSTRGSENKFEPASLLDMQPAMRQAILESQDWTTMVPDTAGVLRLAGAEDGARLHTLTTRLRAPRYSKGTLRVTSTTPTRVTVNGEELIKKTTSDSTASPAEGKLTLEPDRDADIQVDLVSFSSDKAEPQIKIEYIPESKFEDVEIAQGADMKRHLTTQDISLGGRVTGVNMSPDGRYIITSYYEQWDAKNNRSWSTLSETSSGRVISAELPSGCFWMPDGATLYRTRNVNGVYDIVTIDPATMAEKTFAKGVPSSNFSISPKLDYIVYYKEIKGKEETSIMRRVKDPDDRIPGTRDRSYLMKYDLKSGLAYPISAGGPTTQLADISADGKKILYTATRFVPEKFPLYFTDVIQVDATTLKPDTILREVTSLTNVIYSPDGKRLFIEAGPESFGELGKNAGDHPIANEFDCQGYLLDIASGNIKALTRDFNPSLRPNAVWNSKDGLIYVTALDGFYGNLYSINPDNGKINKVPVDLEFVRSFSVGDGQSKWVAAVGTSYTYFGRASLLDLKNGKSRIIDDPWSKDLADVELGKSEPWTFTSTDGTLIDGTITLPPGFDPSKKYPLIVYYYGGTTPSDRTLYHPYSPQIFASRGYVVYVLNPSGTIGYGQEFSARHVNAWGERTADEIIEGTKKFCEAHSFVDSKKIGCLGASYGGFMTMLLQTRTDIFAAAVAHAGISNVTSYWGEGFWGYSYNAAAAAKSYPWSDPEVFHRNSALLNADKIHTPLLLLHGTVDTNVPIGESIQLFNALRLLGRTVELVEVEGSDHVVTDFEQRRVWQNTIMAWFSRWLQDDPRWWDALYGE